MSQCPCGSGLSFDKCCQPYIDGKLNAPTAEAQMRARYTAYTIANIDFIQQTYLNHEEDFDYNGTLNWAKKSKWKGLTIKSTKDGLEGDSEGYVDFVAYFEDENGKDSYHQEKSHFIKKDNKWFFKEGIFEGLAPLQRQGPKIGRNDPCSCGSGKKFKKCCGN